MQRKEKVGLGCATLIMAILLCKFVFGPHPMPDTPQAADAAIPIPTMQTITTPAPSPQPSPQQVVQPTPTTVPQTQAPIVQPTPTMPSVVSQPPTQPPAVTYDTNSVGGQRVYNPPADFCSPPDKCVSTFWTDTRGYVVECGNGKYSHSGGIPGVCSRDGKVVATLYQHG